MCSAALPANVGEWVVLDVSPPKLHHINIVDQRGSEVLLRFYRDVMKMDEMPVELFPRNAADVGGNVGGGSVIDVGSDITAGR